MLSPRPESAPPDRPRPGGRAALRGWQVLGIGLLLVLLWDASGLDLTVARWSGSADGFAWRDHWWMSGVLHDGAKRVSWAIALWLCVGVWWPVGVLRRLQLDERLAIAVITLLAAFSVSVLKGLSATSCPWDLAEFGGVAQYVSHWRLGVADGGPGRCFPGGHASSGFAYIGAAVVLWPRHRRLARVWLAAALLAGLVLGGAQQLRGAHYFSHTLWTAWICAFVSWACWHLWQQMRQLQQLATRRVRPDDSTAPSARHRRTAAD